jgi:fumarate hydratase subunit beta
MAEYHLTTPISEEEIRKLKIEDILYISGTIFLSRDEAHERALEYAKKGKKLPIDIEGLALFHCGPIVKKENDEWTVVSAGPTTSIRMELFEAEFIEKFRIRVVIGKGGMGKKTADAMKKYGCIYTAFTGGAGVLAANAIKRVSGAHWLDLGTPEAFWVFEVEKFGPLMVDIDASGNNYSENLKKKLEANKQEVYEELGIK